MGFTNNDAAGSLEAFSHTLGQLSELIASLTQLEEAKAEAASAKQHNKIDGYLQQEQALILKLRGLEQLHVKQLDALGWKGLNFRQVLDHAEDGQKAVLSPLYDKLRAQLEQLTDSKDSADRILRLRLREFEEALAGTPAPRFHDTYV